MLLFDQDVFRCTLDGTSHEVVQIKGLESVSLMNK